MRKTNLILTLVFASVLLSGVCLSLVIAQDDQALPDHPTTTNQEQTDSNATSQDSVSKDGNQTLYAIEDKIGDPQQNPVPDLLEGEDTKLIANEINSESNLPLIAVAIVLAIIVVGLGVIVCYIKFIENKK